MAVSPILEIEEVAPTQTDKTTTMNDMIVDIEAATNAQISIDMTAGTVDLSFLDYTSALVFVTESQTATATLTVPMITPTGALPAYRLFGVRNIGTHDVLVSGTIGSNVTVVAGGAALIQNDGTDCYGFAVGGPGSIGPVGPVGGAISIPYTFNTSTSNADPGAGHIALNDATQNATTAIYAEVVDANGTNWQSVLDTFDSSTSTDKGTLRLFKTTDQTKWIVFAISARTAHTNYREFTVTVIGASATNPFVASDPLSLEFDRTGDAGSVVLGAGAVTAVTTSGTATVSLGTIASGHLIANATTATAAAADTNFDTFLDLNFGTAGGVLQRGGGGWTESEILTGVTLAGAVSNTGTVSGGAITGAVISASTLVGDTLSGTTTNSGIISGGTLLGVDFAGGSLTGTVTNAGILTGGSITGLSTPSSASDAVTKAYADALAQGSGYKPTATVATTGALPSYTYNNGTAGVGATITITATGTLTLDSHLTALNDLVLVKDETSGNAPNNGLYTVTTAGAVGVHAILTRSIAMNTPAAFPGAFIPVDNAGTVNANSLWLCNPATVVVVGTTAIPFSEMNKAADLTVTGGIHISGNQLSVDWNAGVADALNTADVVLSSTTLQFATRTAHTIMGNAGTAAARPGDIAIGPNLTIETAGTLDLALNPVIGSANTLTATNILANPGTTFSVITPAGATGTANGIAINVTTGKGGATSGSGGSFSLNTGNGYGTGSGGSFLITAGDAESNGTGGGVSFGAGSSQGNGTGGGIDFLAGYVVGTGSGGALQFLAGNGGYVAGTGGTILFKAGDGLGADSSGGGITLTPGAATGTGTVGVLKLAGIVEITGGLEVGTPTGGVPATGTINAQGILINGTSVSGGGGGGGGGALSAITAATGSNTIANGNNAQVWNWAITSATAVGFTFGETTAASSGAGSQFLVALKTLSGSTAGPVQISVQGSVLLTIDPHGGLTYAPPSVASGSGSAISFTGGATSAGSSTAGGAVFLVGGAGSGGGAVAGGAATVAGGAGYFVGGAVVINGGSLTSSGAGGTSGAISIITGSASAGGSTGNLTVSTPAGTTTGATSGAVSITTGDVTSLNPPGDVSITTGTQHGSGGSGRAGNINVTTGASAGGNSGPGGDLIVTLGTSAGGRQGVIQLTNLQTSDPAVSGAAFLDPGGHLVLSGKSYTAPAVSAVTLVGLTTNVGLSAPITGVLVMRPTGSQSGVVGAFKSVSGSWTFSALVGVQGGWSNASQGGAYGIGVSDGTKFSNLFILPPSGSYFINTLNVFRYNTSTSFNSVPAAMIFYPVNPVWLRMVYNSGTGVLGYWMSIDGIDWDEFYSETITSFLTPSTAGMVCAGFASSYSATDTQSIRAYQWSGI